MSPSPPTARMHWVALGCRWLIAAVFLWAALPKLADPAAFAADISNYRIVSGEVAGVLAVALPALELVVALALVAGLEARGAALLAGGMLAVFIAAMGQSMARGIDLDCGCFGNDAAARVGWGSVARNAGLLIAALVVVRAPDAPLFPFRRRFPTSTRPPA